jgi:hypothetical protein
MLTPQQRQRITQFFMTRPLKPCPACNFAGGYHIVDLVVFPYIPTMQVGLHGVPVVLVHCPNCFFLLPFLADGLGLSNGPI